MLAVCGRCLLSSVPARLTAVVRRIQSVSVVQLKKQTPHRSDRPSKKCAPSFYNLMLSSIIFVVGIIRTAVLRRFFKSKGLGG